MKEQTANLPATTREKLQELRTLSDKAEGGDKDARRELRRRVRASTPEIISQVSDTTRRRQGILIRTLAGNEPLTEEGLEARLDLMREEIAGENPTPLETLLAERVVSCWLLVEVLDVFTSVQLQTDRKDTSRGSPSYMSFTKFLLGWQESANRRYLSAMKELARIRKLQSNTPGIQFNTQINLSGE